MGFDKGRRGERGARGRDKRDGFGDDAGSGGGGFGGDRFGAPAGGGGGDRFGGGGGDRFGGGGGGGSRFGGGAAGAGGFRGGGAPRGPAMPAQVVGEGTGVVKFFNGQKGFGFIVQDGGGEDVFVHISAVEQAGLTGLADGQPLGYTLVDRGGKISATDIKIDGEPMPVSDHGPPRDRPERGDRPDRGAGGFGGGDRGGDRGGPPQRELTGEKATGTVKFFNAMKGFGFVQRDDGQPDAFVHISAVERAGMTNLNEGDRLTFDIEVDRRGKFAAVNLLPLE